MSRSAAEMIELASRVEVLTEPDREVDAEIATAARIVPTDMEPASGVGRWRGKYDGRYWQAPEFTASLNAAVTLVPEGMDWCLAVPTDEPCTVSMSPAMKVAEWHGEAVAPALALTAAALRARAQAAGGA